MNFANPHFAEPRWLWLAVLGPLALWVLQRFAAHARRRQMSQLAATTRLAVLARSHSPGRRLLKELLLVLALAGIGLTLARPQWGERAEESQALGEDIIFILDCSRSMLAPDLRPSRLQRGKYAILDFVQRHGRGRVGLIAFAGQAFLQCPLTFDYEAFRETLLAVDEKTIPVPGTNLGRALEEAFLAMEKAGRRKIMVLLTDGEDLEKTGVAMAGKLAEKGVVIYTLGAGTPGGASIEFLNPQGQIDYVRDAAGQVVQSRLDEVTLKTIAETTRGRYQPLGPVGEGMDWIRSAVENIRDLPSGATLRKYGVDHFHMPLAVVTLLLVMEPLLGTRRKLKGGPL